MNTVKSLQEFKELIQSNDLVVGYFSTETCNVCKVLRPKIYNLIQENYTKIQFVYVQIDKIPEAQGEYLVFAVPTIIVFADGKEIQRFSRHISVTDVDLLLNRYYSLLFENEL